MKNDTKKKIIFKPNRWLPRISGVFMSTMKLKPTGIFRRIGEGEIIPKYYGIAYYEFDSGCAVASIIPFNLLIGLFRKTWFGVKAGIRPSLLEQSYRRGFGDGLDEGRRIGEGIVERQVLEYFRELEHHD